MTVPVERRYYLAPIGQKPPGPHGGGAYYLLLPPGTDYTALIPTGPDGIPVWTWGLAVVHESDYSALDADNRLVMIPGDSLGLRWDQLTNPQRNAILTRLADVGVPTDTITGATTIREIIILIATHLDPSFDPRLLDRGGL